MKKIELVTQLVSFALEQSKKGNHFWVDYSGHVDNISIRGMAGEWESGKPPIETFSCTLKELSQAKIDRWLDTFKFHLENSAEFKLKALERECVNSFDKPGGIL